MAAGPRLPKQQSLTPPLPGLAGHVLVWNRKAQGSPGQQVGGTNTQALISLEASWREVYPKLKLVHLFA